MAIFELGRASRRDNLKGPSGQLTANQDGLTLPGALAQVTRFIPAEILGLFIATRGMLNTLPLTRVGSAWVAVLCAVLIPILLVLGAKLPSSSGSNRPPRRKTLVKLGGVSLIAFAAWVCALPDGPFILVFGDFAPTYGGIAVLVLSVLLPYVASNLIEKE